jgi:hypothetical protein
VPGSRDAGHRPDSRPHVAFGHGVHQCVGQQLARTELRLAVSRLFRRFADLRLAVSPDQVTLRHDKIFASLDSLPVTWDKVTMSRNHRPFREKFFIQNGSGTLLRRRMCGRITRSR